MISPASAPRAVNPRMRSLCKFSFHSDRLRSTFSPRLSERYFPIARDLSRPARWDHAKSGPETPVQIWPRSGRVVGSLVRAYSILRHRPPHNDQNLPGHRSLRPALSRRLPLSVHVDIFWQVNRVAFSEANGLPTSIYLELARFHNEDLVFKTMDV